MSTTNDETFDTPDDAVELDDTQLKDVAGGQSGWTPMPDGATEDPGADWADGWVG